MWISNIFQHAILSSNQLPMEAQYINYIKARLLWEEEREGPGAQPSYTSFSTPPMHRSPGAAVGTLGFCGTPSENHRSRAKGRPKHRLCFLIAPSIAPRSGDLFHQHPLSQSPRKDYTEQMDGKLSAQCLVRSGCLISRSYEADFVGPF